MSDSALHAPQAAPPAAAGDTPAREPVDRSHGFARRHIWWLIGIALVAVSIALVQWADTRPSYDAYGWLVWGQQTLHGTLDLGGSPSWKPLPFLFTVPYALFGDGELKLWMFTAVALSLAGALFAARIAYRLTLTGVDWGSGGSLEIEDLTPGRRAAGLAAGLFAGASLLGIEDYMHYILSVQSDPVIVACVLAAIDCHLRGHRRWAFGLLWLASMGRPEGWPWFFLYGIYGWWRVPSMRWLIVAGVVLLLFFWFGVPTITNNRPFVSAQLAFNSPRELKNNQIFGTIDRFKELHYLPVWLAAGICLLFAAARRNITVLALAVASAGWVVVEIAFALHGWPGLPRYMFEPGGVVAVLAGVAVGWLLLDLPRLRAGIPRWAGIPIVVALFAVMVPEALAREHTEHTDLRHERARTKQLVMLGNVVETLGGYKFVRSCGKPAIPVEWMSSLAYTLHMDVGLLAFRFEPEIRRGHPIVIFDPPASGDGWWVNPVHSRGANTAACKAMHATFVMPRGSSRVVRKRGAPLRDLLTG